MNDNKINNNIAKNYNIDYRGNSNNKNEVVKIKTNIKNTVNKVTKNNNVIEEINLSSADVACIEANTSTCSIAYDI